jgi:hypothetical protein
VAAAPRLARVTTYDQARQFGKTYVGALNTSPSAFAALFAADARGAVGGAPATPAGVREATPPWRSSFKGVEMDGAGFRIRVRVLEPGSHEDRMHRVELDAGGRIVALDA